MTPIANQKPANKLTKIKIHFQCRLCGKNFSSKIQSMDYLILKQPINKIIGNELLISHHCGINGNIGIADAQGISYL